MVKQTVIITGGTTKDTICEFDQPWLGGEVMWNSSRAMRDALHGRFGPPRIENWRGRKINEANLNMKKVEMFRGMPEVLESPGIVVEVRDVLVSGLAHHMFIDGNHRAAARLKNKTYDLIFWFIPAEIEHEYRVTIQVTEE